MALFHLNVKQVKRSEGSSVVASAAYRAGEKLYSEYDGMTSDYTRKGGVLYSEIMLPSYAPEEYRDRQTLWNAVEFVEKNKNAQLAYNFEIALQNELTFEENRELAREFLQKYFVDDGMMIDFAIHEPDKEGGIPNPHFHVLAPIRPIEENGEWGYKQHRVYSLDEDGNRIKDEDGKYVYTSEPTTDWGESEKLELWREKWAEIVNAKFEEKGLECRIDHRSYVDQGLDLIPTVHEGANVRQMEARGIRTEKGELNRWIKATNALVKDLHYKIKSLFSWIKEIREELAAPQEPNLVDLLRDYFNARNAGANSFGKYGARKAKTGNLKQFVDSTNFLMEKKIYTLSDLENYLDSVRTSTDGVKSDMDSKMKRIKELKELLRYADMYEESRPVHDAYTSIKFKKAKEKYQQEHDGDLRRYQVAKRKIGEVVNSGGKYAPKSWQNELAGLESDYAQLSPQLKPMREELMKLLQVKHNVDTVLQSKEQVESQETEKKKPNMEL